MSGMEYYPDKCRSSGGELRGAVAVSTSKELLVRVRLLPKKSELPEFPSPKPLVFNKENTHLLAAILPALDTYKCLVSYDIIPPKRRSPWVCAFWGLHRLSGHWGKYQHKPNPETNKHVKYDFKSKKIPAIHKHLQRYQGNSQVHKELLRRLDEYEARKRSKERVDQ